MIVKLVASFFVVRLALSTDNRLRRVRQHRAVPLKTAYTLSDLSAASARISAASSTEDIISAALEEALRASNADFALLYRLTQPPSSTQATEPLRCVGSRSRSLSGDDPLPGDTIAQTCYREKRIISDEHAGRLTNIALPLMVRGQCVGVLQMSSAPPRSIVFERNRTA